MPFYKREGDELLCAPNFVHAPDYQLSFETRDDHTYPVDGWYWFTDLDSAMQQFTVSSALKCTRRQGLLALLTFSIKRSDIETSIDAIEDETERESAWIEYLADTWELDNPRLQAMWESLGGAQEQLPELFKLAVTL